MLDKVENQRLEDITVIVKQVAARHGLRHEIGPTDCLADRGLTSMALVELILALETKFDVTIPQCKLTAANLRSIASLGEIVDRL